MIVWYYGDPGAGKTTLARQWVEDNYPAVMLDGDAIRKACEDFDFSREGRSRSCRRMAKLAKELSEFGVHVAIAACAPYVSTRSACRSLCPDIAWIHVDTPRAVCEQRKPDLYAKHGDEIPHTEII